MLKDAKGYRSPYINALNNAVAASRIIGGDVIPEETPSGTILTITQTKRAGRFELFCGYDEGESTSSDSPGDSPGNSGGDGSGSSSSKPAGADALCLSDGTLYVAAVKQDLKLGRDVFRREGTLQPRGTGWCTRKTITESQSLTFACVRYAGEYYIIAQIDGESASELLPESLGTVDQSQLEVLFTFGQFYWTGPTGDKSLRIRQDVRGDVWYGGGGEATAETPYAWRIRAVTPPEVDPETPAESQPSGFQVFAPFAVISDAAQPTVPDGFLEVASWQDISAAILPASSSGAWTLYAILKHTPEIPASGSGSSATPAQEAKTEFTLSTALPDTSSDPAGTQYRLFHIASRDASGALTQIQAGPIIETFPPAAAGLCAGPITYDSASGHVVQYLGNFSASGSFSRAKDDNGNAIIAVDYGEFIKTLRKPSSNAIQTATAFQPLGTLPAAQTAMQLQTAQNLTTSLQYTPPESEYGVGELTARTGVSFTFWGSAPSAGVPTTLLQTITENANEKTIYEG